MAKKLRVATWNIAGGCTLGSSKLFDYKDENLDYFIAQLAQLDADVICLQESHANAERSLAKRIAQALGYKGVFDSPLSPSHINPEYQLALAVVAKKEPSKTQLYEYPDPPFDLRFPDGRLALKHRKGLQVVEYQGVTISNTHWLPMFTFGHSYAAGEGAEYGAELAKIMTAHLTPPSIVCGDFNAGEFEFDRALTPIIEQLRLKNALPDVSTFHLPGRLKPDQPNAPDRIYATAPEFSVLDGGVVPTDTDHYLCWADIAL